MYRRAQNGARKMAGNYNGPMAGAHRINVLLMYFISFIKY